jgi:hypothetical protein
MSTKLDTFPPNTSLPPPWRPFVIGDSALELAGGTLRFVTTNAAATRYSDAQIDDYQKLARRDFLWRPPLQLTVRARFSHPAGQLKGTAGFGFWNDPFLMTGKRWPTLPRAIWFFYSSPPSNMKLGLRTPGPGWKAATLDAWRWPFFALLPTAPLAVPLMNIDWLYRRCWPIGQQAIGVSEALLAADMTEWHTYTITWRKKTANFSVDGQTVLETNVSPGGPLGLVIWLDNQSMVVTPWGQFGYSLVDAPGRQWLEISHVEVRA